MRNKKAKDELSIAFFLLPLKIGKRQIKERRGDKNKEHRECWCPDGGIKKIKIKKGASERQQRRERNETETEL